MEGCRIFRNGNGGVEISIEEVSCTIHFFLNLTVCIGDFQKLPVDEEEKLLEQKGEQFLKGGSAYLQFVDNLPEKLKIIRRGTRT